MIEAFGLSDQGLVRKNNEDQFFSSSTAGLCVLADGMGGAQAGEMAATLAVSAVVEIATSEPPSQALLEAAFQEADRRVRVAAESDTSLRGMGTTLVAALETPAGLAVATIGDSRCWLWQHGRLMLLTSDQSWANEIGRSLGLTDEALSAHPLRNALTTAVGVGVLRQVQSVVVPVQAGSVILLSSDGLHGVVSPEAIAEVLSQDGPLLFQCQALIDIALASGGPDNVTVVLGRV